MNPPYGTRGGNSIHLDFTEKCIQLCNEVVCVMPFELVSSNNTTYKKYKESLQKYAISVDEEDSSIFDISREGSVGIYYFINDLDNILKSNHIHIEYLNGKAIDTNTFEIPIFNEYEQDIINLLYPNYKNIMWTGYADHPARHKLRISKKAGKDLNKREILAYLKKEQLDKLPNNKIYLVANKTGSYQFITQRVGMNIIYDNKQKLINDILNYNPDKSSNGYNIFIFDTIKEAKNCYIALQNSVLRFPLSRIKADRNMPIETCYKYIPDIDWSDPRVTTDEGLLEVCGCSKDKCKEYAEYCREYMKEFDKKKTKK